MAEIAFVVRDEWQNRGIGSALFKHLTLIARRNGISGFTAEVLKTNRAMQKVIAKSGFDVTSMPSSDVYSFRIKFD
jgi:GNAT superfamily N-acetyltransferase